MIIFAYGSNMNSNRLRKRVPSATKISNAFIVGYKLVCNKISTDGSSKANIVQTNNQNDVVWGVLFRIDNNQKTDLDRVEGLGNGYDETTLNFIETNNLSHQAQVYIANNSYINNQLLPYDWYKQYMLTGAQQNQLPKNYIDMIQNFDCTVDIDTKRREKHLKILNE